ncbi:hypothetical protein FLK61_35260 [Paenalkalicoccus suaedae]|uniref:Uncharacterized protein n=1 Tax=Paenalkalicoccus suaedae TaxID=2592382 RepID=A0A859FFL8_9BACI|nr:hypothetical protein [Paenalkalicoccus suaedae]QKS71929.1 hypothetical protein FLK61_35260 [Paenalkalicoccus suaedae]
MIEQAIKYLVKLGNVEAQKINERFYSTEKLYRIEDPSVDSLQVNTLSGLVEYVKSEFDTSVSLMVHVVSPTEVRVFDKINMDKNRDTYITAHALLPSLSFNHYYSVEDFNIELQSTFVSNEDRATMLQVVGNVKEEAVNQIGDDGMSQSVVARTGVAQVGNVKVPNPVQLMPYRTFLEIEQPESPFVFRMQSGPKCALFEADGGAWKLEVMKSIAEYLESELTDLIGEDRVMLLV